MPRIKLHLNIMHFLWLKVSAVNKKYKETKILCVNYNVYTNAITDVYNYVVTMMSRVIR